MTSSSGVLLTWKREALKLFENEFKDPIDQNYWSYQVRLWCVDRCSDHLDSADIETLCAPTCTFLSVDLKRRVRSAVAKLLLDSEAGVINKTFSTTKNISAQESPLSSLPCIYRLEDLSGSILTRSLRDDVQRYLLHKLAPLGVCGLSFHAEMLVEFGKPIELHVDEKNKTAAVEKALQQMKGNANSSLNAIDFCTVVAEETELTQYK
jgi:hypothetical protein